MYVSIYIYILWIIMDNLPLYSQDFTIFTRSYLQYWIPWPCLSQDGSDPDILQRDHGLEEVTERQRVWHFLESLASNEPFMSLAVFWRNHDWLVVWNIFCFFPYIGINHPAQVTNIFQRGWNHQPDEMTICCLYQCFFHVRTKIWNNHKMLFNVVYINSTMMIYHKKVQ